MAFAQNLKEQVGVEQVSEDCFVSLKNPDKMGNTADIAYGGCTLASAVNAAYQTVPPGFHCFSVMGNYLGPAFSHSKLFCKIRRIRDTRSFQSRQVEVSQKQKDGTQRLCMIMFAEFQNQEPASLMRYSVPPSQEWPTWQDCPTRSEYAAQLVKDGKVPQKMVDINGKVFGLMSRLWDGRVCPNSIMTQNLYGMAKDLPTTQDHLPLTSKISGEWAKAKAQLTTEGEQIASLAFYMDGAISFMPLSFSHKFLQDAGACSSLDFALRIFTNKLDINQWHIKEMKTIVGAEGRTYGEARLWDEKGSMVASMTQQCILRTPTAKAGKAAL
ncbi:acyl-CoA thioesterase II [Tothia fuscella]|uniref:Acyl-CoA thioesterase II n=1 Tax=Tothia fuscella TaxID=1048955 RepID=A0A9P4NXJ8_9PEZI|nr:acyl-CoA thioesterase II [Tothia fuscella]